MFNQQNLRTMNKLSFFKGFLIASLFSATFWVGVYQVVTTNNDVKENQEQIAEPIVNQKPIA